MVLYNSIISLIYMIKRFEKISNKIQETINSFEKGGYYGYFQASLNLLNDNDCISQAKYENLLDEVKNAQNYTN